MLEAVEGFQNCEKPQQWEKLDLGKQLWGGGGSKRRSREKGVMQTEEEGGLYGGGRPSVLVGTWQRAGGDGEGKGIRLEIVRGGKKASFLWRPGGGGDGVYVLFSGWCLVRVQERPGGDSKYEGHCEKEPDGGVSFSQLLLQSYS